MQNQVPHFLRVPQVVLWESLPRSFRRVPHFSLILGEVGFFACASPIPLSPSELKPSSATAIIRSIIIPDSIRHLCSSRLQKKILSQRIFDSNSTYLRFSRQAPPTPPLAPKVKGRAVSRRRIFKDLNLNQIVISSEARNLLFGRRSLLPRPQIQSPLRT